MLASLALDLTSLGVTASNGSGKVTIGWNHDQRNVGLRGSSDHVLDEGSVARSIDHSVVLGLSEELLGRAGNGDTTLTLLLLAVHVEGKGEGTLSEAVGFVSELLHLSLRNSSQFEDQSSGGRGFSSIDVPTNNNTDVLLTFSHLS